MWQREITCQRGQRGCEASREESSLCLVNVGWSSALCLYPQSSEWVAVDGTGYILCLVGGRQSVCVCVCVSVCVRMRR